MVKLYCQHPGGDRYLGAYRDQKAAEAFWHLMLKRLQELHGKDIQPVYVKTGKGSRANSSSQSDTLINS